MNDGWVMCVRISIYKDAVRFGVANGCRHKEIRMNKMCDTMCVCVCVCVSMCIDRTTVWSQLLPFKVKFDLASDWSQYLRATHLYIGMLRFWFVCLWYNFFFVPRELRCARVRALMCERLFLLHTLNCTHRLYNVRYVHLKQCNVTNFWEKHEHIDTQPSIKWSAWICVSIFRYAFKYSHFSHGNGLTIIVCLNSIKVTNTKANQSNWPIRLGFNLAIFYFAIHL